MCAGDLLGPRLGPAVCQPNGIVRVTASLIEHVRGGRRCFGQAREATSAEWHAQREHADSKGGA